jgi:hypothetical protein
VASCSHRLILGRGCVPGPMARPAATLCPGLPGPDHAHSGTIPDRRGGHPVVPDNEQDAIAPCGFVILIR